MVRAACMHQGDDKPITGWIDRVKRDGDESAYTHLWHEYLGRLMAMARAKLYDGQRRVQDEEDVVLSVMNGFYTGAREGKFPELGDRESLWRLLVTMTSRKISNQVRDQKAQKRGGGEVRGESVFAADDDAALAGIAGLPDTQLTPELAAEVTELWRSLFLDLKDDQLAEVARLKLENYNCTEIANHMNCSPRTIERRLAEIRRIWSQHLDSDG